MKIYDREGAPNTARIRIVLAEKGLEEQPEFVSADLIAAEQKQPRFLAMNPIGKIPVLELEDGLAISESTAITEYLDNLDGNPKLTGRSPREKAVIHMMQRRVEMMVLEPLDDFFHYGTPGSGRRWPRIECQSGTVDRVGRAAREDGAKRLRLLQRASHETAVRHGRSFLYAGHHPLHQPAVRGYSRPAGCPRP